jgi:hypothetical protein
MDVGLLAGLEDAELGVERVEVGDHPVGHRLGAVLGVAPGGVGRFFEGLLAVEWTV